MLNNKEILDFILSSIEKVNDSRFDFLPIGNDETNQELTDIFHHTMNKFEEFDFELVDDADKLTELFGIEGFESIRDAENGERRGIKTSNKANVSISNISGNIIIRLILNDEDVSKFDRVTNVTTETASRIMELAYCRTTRNDAPVWEIINPEYTIKNGTLTIQTEPEKLTGTIADEF